MLKSWPNECSPNRSADDPCERLAAALRNAFPLPKSGSFQHLLRALDEKDAEREDA